MVLLWRSGMDKDEGMRANTQNIAFLSRFANNV